MNRQLFLHGFGAGNSFTRTEIVPSTDSAAGFATPIQAPLLSSCCHPCRHRADPPCGPGFKAVRGLSNKVLVAWDDSGTDAPGALTGSGEFSMKPRVYETAAHADELGLCGYWSFNSMGDDVGVIRMLSRDSPLPITAPDV